MPESLHPPYNITQPRVLNRWLDVNSQNGPLQRAGTYFTIPSFNNAYILASTGSDMRASFNYRADQNFSIVNPEAALTMTSCILCVSFVDVDGSTKRYKLNVTDNEITHVGELYQYLFFTVPQYTNQLIRKNFRIEIWDIVQTGAVTEPITFITSVRTNLDTRYGDDEELVINDPITTKHSVDIITSGPLTGLFVLPFIFPNTVLTN